MTQKLLMTVIAAASLAACGGGGDVAPAQVGATPSATTISGTAAVGAALAGATVDVKCATGSGSATTGADGSFSVSIDNAVRPCVLAVTSPAGATLHSIVEAGSGATAVANITPLSELMVAALAQGDTAAFFTNFDAAAQATLTPEGVTGAREQMTLALTGIVDLSGVDPIQDPLVAASGSSPGNGLDQTLDALGAKLAQAQVTLADVVAAVVANPGSPAPVKTMLQPAAAGCASLKSGTYRALDLLAGDAGDNWKIQIDATALTVAYPDGTSEVLVDQGGCHFTLVSDEPASIYVSKSGVSVVRDGADTVPAAPVLVLPEQTIALSELAGTWNGMSHERGDPGEPTIPLALTFAFDANGKLTAGADCDDFETCAPWDNAAAAITVHPDGGFNYTDSNGSARMFAFKSADGHLTLYLVGHYGFYIAARPQPQALPAVASTRSTWDFNVNGAGTMGAATAGSTQTTAVDAVAKTFTRYRAVENRVDTWAVDQPRQGLSKRAANSSTVDGVAQMHGPAYAMTLPGVGVSVVGLPASNMFSFSVVRP